MISTRRVMKNNTSDTTYITLESIAQRKEELRKEISSQKQLMTDMAKSLFAPSAPATSKSTGIVHAFKTSFAIFDGALLGLRMIKKVRKMFSSKK
jgi:hypothetical protein